ncbi:MAG: molybdopterin molybdotransferase MoeA [Alphaproteobacteria bacterium]|nr:MAG: molybdopterin molybdotransferase MoeA [Alphaproteobacteria bacterium]
MIAVEEALAQILARATPTPIETVKLPEAHERVLAQDIASRRTQPPMAVSAMDGYAVRAEDAVLGARLSRVGEAPAGGSYDHPVGAGEAVRIFTGGPVPEGADAIVLQEDVSVAADGAIVLGEAAIFGQHIRKAGVDFATGDVLLKAGRVLSPADVGLLASMDWPDVPVRQRPKVAILATGDELVLPGEPLGPNQIVSSNSFAIAALVNRSGGEAMDLGIAEDNIETIKEMALRGKDADIFVTVGGASVGDHDLVQPALAELGLDVDFWKIAMRPGKPLIFGGLADQAFIGLPGNPVSALVCATLYLAPMIRQMLGVTPASIPTRQARLGRPLSDNKARQDYIRATLSLDDKGRDVVTPFDLQDSSVLSLFAHADVLIIRRPHAKPAEVGDIVEVLPLR